MLSDRREIFGRLVQCRTGHGYMGDYYRRFVIKEEQLGCPCGEPLQTRDHILAVCPIYEHFREDLRQASRDISLPEILGTTKGIKALASFLEKSGAFTKSGQPQRKPSLPAFEDEPIVDGESDDELGYDDQEFG